VAQDFLQIKDTGITDSTANHKDLTDAEIQAWVKKGPIGRLYIVVVHIRRSPGRTQEFLKLSGGSAANSIKIEAQYAVFD
jgi:hypothetical protein